MMLTLPWPPSPRQLLILNLGQDLALPIKKTGEIHVVGVLIRISAEMERHVTMITNVPFVEPGVMADSVARKGYVVMEKYWIILTGMKLVRARSMTRVRGQGQKISNLIKVQSPHYLVIISIALQVETSILNTKRISI